MKCRSSKTPIEESGSDLEEAEADHRPDVPSARRREADVRTTKTRTTREAEKKTTKDRDIDIVVL